MEALGVLALVGIVLVWVLVIKGDADRYRVRREGKRQAADYLDSIPQYPYPQPGQQAQQQQYLGYQPPQQYPGYQPPQAYPQYPGYPGQQG
ncbi:hypothetical protein KIH27_03340 [Mycobacterium sp. M1]|uniref:Uncharacterized protein n=1 Tax=Mycolicibacter acidiphilus TaxID=2835306 RepID=A0ABS5RF65_9MYCO|nr:hypothetical protein [Mycolicibacter acidiphilus]MBS9532617.1 hypothetical protein [Mycolicibacter acidiphilus]